MSSWFDEPLTNNFQSTMISKKFHYLFIVLTIVSIIAEAQADSKAKINPKITFSADRSQATLAFELNQLIYVYELVRNDNLFRDTISNQDNCYYDDALKGPWAAISTCNSQINGAVDVDGRLVEIFFDSKANAHYMSEFTKLVFGANGGDDASKIESDLKEGDTKGKSRIGDVIVPKNRPREITVRIHADIEFVRTKLGNPNADASEIIRLVMLQVARLYKQVNIQISYASEFYHRDEIPILKNLFHQLKAFKNLIDREPFDYEGVDLNCLLTGHHYPDENSLGISFVNGLCHPEYSMFIVTSTPYHNTFASTMQLAVTFAHEVAHAIGIKHDTINDPDCLCFTASPDQQCIMAKQIIYPPYEWSDCTFNHLLEFSKTKSGCVHDTRDANREPFPEKLYNVTSLRLNALLVGFALGIVLVSVAIGVHKFTPRLVDED